MGNARTFTVWLVVLSLQLAPRVTYADVGPGREVRAIRHDLPIILASRVDPRDLTIDAVVVYKDVALAQASSHGTTSVYVLTRQLRTWWLDMGANATSSGIATSCARGPNPAPEDATAVVALGRQLLPKLRPTPDPLAVVIVDCGGLIRQSEVPSLGTVHPQPTGPYDFSLVSANADGARNLTSFEWRAPTEGESWLTPNNNGYAFFSAVLDSLQLLALDAGTRLDVWFPFALDPSNTYSLTIAHVTPIIGPLNGTLKDNTLHFVLPAFAVAPGAELMGEIDGDPYDR